MTKVVFMGTPQFAVPILESLVKDGYDVEAVVTQPDRKVGRKQKIEQNPVKQAAEKLNLRVLQPEKISGSDEMQTVIDLQPDLIVTAAFGQFLPTKLLDAAKIGAINVHGSLLPQYRGGAPIQYSILNGDKETGITIMYMAKKMDAGDIITQAAIPIEADDDTGTLFEKLSYLGRDLLLETLPDIIAGKAPRIKQDEEKVTIARNLTPEQEKIDLNQDAQQINQLIRTMRPHPGAYLMINGNRVKIWDAVPVDEITNETPGTVVTRTKKNLAVATGDHTVLQINEIQPAGKAKMPIQSFLNGAGQSIKIGDKLSE